MNVVWKQEKKNQKWGGFALFPTPHPPNDMFSFYHVLDPKDIWTLHCVYHVHVNYLPLCQKRKNCNIYIWVKCQIMRSKTLFLLYTILRYLNYSIWDAFIQSPVFHFITLNIFSEIKPPSHQSLHKWKLLHMEGGVSVYGKYYHTSWSHYRCWNA